MGHPCKFQRVSRLCSVTARHSSSGRQPNCGVEQRAPPIFGRAAITLGIGPHSSLTFVSYYLQLRRTDSVVDCKVSCFKSLVKSKFHYAIQLATRSQAGLRSARELVRKLVREQLVSWTKTCVCMLCACCRPNSITLSSSRPGRRPASEQDSVMEYCLNRSATRFELS